MTYLASEAAYRFHTVKRATAFVGSPLILQRVHPRHQQAPISGIWAHFWANRCENRACNLAGINRL